MRPFLNSYLEFFFQTKTKFSFCDSLPFLGTRCHPVLPLLIQLCPPWRWAGGITVYQRSNRGFYSPPLRYSSSPLSFTLSLSLAFKTVAVRSVTTSPDGGSGGGDSTGAPPAQVLLLVDVFAYRTNVDDAGISRVMAEMQGVEHL